MSNSGSRMRYSASESPLLSLSLFLLPAYSKPRLLSDAVARLGAGVAGVVESEWSALCRLLLVAYTHASHPHPCSAGSSTRSASSSTFWTEVSARLERAPELLIGSSAAYRGSKGFLCIPAGAQLCLVSDIDTRPVFHCASSSAEGLSMPSLISSELPVDGPEDTFHPHPSDAVLASVEGLERSLAPTPNHHVPRRCPAQLEILSCSSTSIFDCDPSSPSSALTNISLPYRCSRPRTCGRTTLARPVILHHLGHGTVAYTRPDSRCRYSPNSAHSGRLHIHHSRRRWLELPAGAPN
ncbi:hypothetical protein C8F01DRAFT_549614 [Mycena amicta]|nr:hypothetical protein C8F01DRAFT_549614 [Mycena amicta]